MKYIHEFQNNTEFENYYFGQNYIEPYVSWTVDVDRLDYNKSGKALLRSMPLTFNVLTDGTITLNKNMTSSTTIDYKLNNEDWTTGVSTPFTINVVSGDSVQFRLNTGSIATWGGIVFHYFGGTATFNAKGNIMSLYPGASSDFESRTSLDNSYTNTFYKLFINCTGLIDASELILPATTLASDCYYNMFSGCTSLTAAPELPATTLASDCYYNMFSGCTSLNSAPVLPATTLEEHCYDHMFSGCTSLTATPELPATTLVNSCYLQMFYGCEKLNYIKCLATDISASNCTSSWVYNVSSTGTFVKNPAMTSWTTGASGIPSGWTVQDVANE